MDFKHNQIDLYGSKIEIPVPELFVAYNGIKTLNEYNQGLKIESASIKVDVNVKVVDITFDNLENKQTENILAGYSYFYKIYDAQILQGKSKVEAFNSAREACMKDGYLKGIVEKEDFIVYYKDVLDYDHQIRWEGREEGVIIGYQKVMDKVESMLLKKLLAKAPLRAVKNEADHFDVQDEDFNKIILTVYDKFEAKGERPGEDLFMAAMKIKADEHNKNNASRKATKAVKDTDDISL